MNGQMRPWCLPCRENDGSEAWAMHLGLVCDWHWGLLSDPEQEVLRAAVLVVHPKGGRVTRVLEQIWILRGAIRRDHPSIGRKWTEEWADFQAEQNTFPPSPIIPETRTDE